MTLLQEMEEAMDRCKAYGGIVPNHIVFGRVAFKAIAHEMKWKVRRTKRWRGKRFNVKVLLENLL